MENLRQKLKGNIPEWMINIKIPSHLIDQAIKEGCTSFTTNVKKYNITHKIFDLKYKTAKKKNQTMKIDSVYFLKNKNGFFSTSEYNGEKIMKNIRANDNFYIYGKKMSNLVWNKILDKWKLCIPLNDKQCRPKNRHNIASIDPGTRDFNVLYSEDHMCVLGKNVSIKLHKVCKEIDIIKSRINRKTYYTKNEHNEKVFNNVNSKRRKNLRKALHRKIEKIKNMRNDLHYKIVNYLCKNYKHVIIPHFDTQKMVSNGYLSSKVARKMYTLSFYLFKKRLLEKANNYRTKVIIKSEAYTSKTCTRCGEINNLLGSKKIFNCPKCNLVLDRDFNGARNILLKNFEYL
jgi:putative transposase